LNFYKHHIGDYAQATSHLSFVEDAAYSRMIRKYYAEEAPLPIDTKAVQRLVGARTREEREAVATVLEEFFSLEADGWHNKRCDSELLKANAQAETNRRIAEEREAKKRVRTEHESFNESTHDQSTNRSPTTSVEREPSQTPDTRHQTPDSTINVVNTSTSVEVDPARPSAEPPQLALVDPGQPQPHGPPDCPHREVLALWAEVLPAMPQHLPSQWKGARADHLRARWRETAVDKGWTDKGEGIEYLRRFFGYVAKSPFLTGRVKPRDPDQRPFVVELEWLVLPSNWAKVHEGKYHQEAA